MYISYYACDRCKQRIETIESGNDVEVILNRQAKRMGHYKSPFQHICIPCAADLAEKLATALVLWKTMAPTSANIPNEVKKK